MKKTFFALVMSLMLLLCSCAGEGTGTKDPKKGGAFDIIGKVRDSVELLADGKCTVTVYQSEDTYDVNKNGVVGEHTLILWNQLRGSYTFENGIYSIEADSAYIVATVEGSDPEGFKELWLSRFEEGSDSHNRYKAAFTDGYAVSNSENTVLLKTDMTFEKGNFLPLNAEAYTNGVLVGKAEFKNGLTTKQTIYSSYDGHEYVSEINLFDDRGNMTRSERYDENSALTGYELFEYDSASNCTKQTYFNEDGTETLRKEYDYDENSKKTRYAEYEQVQTLIREEYYNADGDIRKSFARYHDYCRWTDYETGDESVYYIEKILKNNSDVYEIYYFGHDLNLIREEQIPVSDEK